MASATTGRVALFSIKPQFADAILAGSKQVEFRRTALAKDVTHVVIYATSPVQRVIGAFEVAGVEHAPPAALWMTFGQVGGIALKDYEDYFVGAESGYAIKVHRPRSWPRPLTLHELSPGLRAPQSYQYLSEDALTRIGPLLAEPGQQQMLLRRLAGGLLARLRSALPGYDGAVRPEVPS